MVHLLTTMNLKVRSSDGGSEANEPSSGEEFANNDESEEEDSSAEEPYGSDRDTENYNKSE